MYPLGSRPMRRRSHLCGKAPLLAKPHDFIRVGSDHDRIERRTPPHSLINPGKQRDASDLAQHFARKARRGEPRRNYSNYFHAPSFAWSPAVREPSAIVSPESRSIIIQKMIIQKTIIQKKPGGGK